MIEILVHAANILILLSFSVRDIFWLRLLSILAGLCFIPYFALQPEPLYAPIAWNAVFITINLVQIWRLYLERRPVYLSEDEERLRQLVFKEMSARELVGLLRLGSWSQAEEETCLCKHGEQMECLIIIFTGGARVDVGERTIAQLAPGAFVGETSFLTGGLSSADVVAVEPTRYLSWSRSTLRAFLSEQPEMKARMQSVLGADMARKLRNTHREPLHAA